MAKTYLNPPELFPSQPYGFAQMVVSRGGAQACRLALATEALAYVASAS